MIWLNDLVESEIEINVLIPQHNSIQQDKIDFVPA